MLLFARVPLTGKSRVSIFASSCSVYGVGGREELNEESVVNPQTPYSLNKYQIETDLASIL